MTSKHECECGIVLNLQARCHVSHITTFTTRTTYTFFRAPRLMVVRFSTTGASLEISFDSRHQHACLLRQVV